MMSSFGHLLRRSRIEAGLTQEALAAVAGLSTRAISDLERGINHTPRRETTRLLADALNLAGQERAEFEAAARGPGPVDAFAAATRTLPADTMSFTGRRAEMEQLDRMADRGAIYAIGGMPGVGKTALAVHAAHALAGHFPDRQMFIDLHAHTPGHKPLRPEDALEALLTSIGVDRRYLPGDLDGRAAMWRDRMAGQRAMLVLDNAADSSQVAPLLPGHAGCLVLVTSRRHLGDLPGAIAPALLGTLPREDAMNMFTQLVPRASGDADGVAEVAELAGFLPLAISLLARVLDRHPCWSLTELARETNARLLTVTAENRSIAAAFEVSYQYLDAGRQRFFCLLGLHPGATTDEYAAAALTGISLGEAAEHLEALHGEGLLTETRCRRYGMHDLIRRYAREKAVDTSADSQQALGRLLDYYQHAAALASERLARQARPGPLPLVPAGLQIPGLEDDQRALAWVRAERACLLACLDMAARDGQYARVAALTAGLAVALWRDGPWADAVTRHTAAVDAAQRVGDRLSEANALTDLGIVQRLTGTYSAAAEVLEEALGIYRELDDRLGEANTLRELGAMRAMVGEYPNEAQVLEEALGIYRELDDRLGEANSLRELGIARWLTGDFPGAAEVLEEALSIYSATGNRHGQANVLTDLGGVRQATGDFPGAAEVLEEALSIYSATRNRHGQANALTQLGTVRRSTGDFPGAAEVLEKALKIYSVTGNRHGQANALTELGPVRQVMGEHSAAAQVLEQALVIWRHLGSRHGETAALNEQATLYRAGGDIVRAQQCHQQALDLARAISSAWDEARALAGLGGCAVAASDIAQARILLRQALQILQRIGAAETCDILAELSTLTGPESA